MKPQIVDDYLANGCGRCPLGGTPECKVHSWEQELVELRRIMLDLPVVEEIKWSFPCYTFEGNNILLLTALKDYCALDFFKGVLLKDPENVLIQQTENMQATRQLRFTTVGDILDMEETIRAYVLEAIEIEQKGLKVEYKGTDEFEVPEEFLSILEDNPELQEAFESLTPGRQRGYLLYFAGAKQSKTRTARVEKYIPKILDGKGFHDR